MEIAGEMGADGLVPQTVMVDVRWCFVEASLSSVLRSERRDGWTNVIKRVVMGRRIKNFSEVVKNVAMGGGRRQMREAPRRVHDVWKKAVSGKRREDKGAAESKEK